MSQSVITTAFEQLKAEQAANGGILTLDEFVFANVPDLNITDPIDRGESWPAPEQIVHRQVVSKTGTVNGNAVVYSVVLGAETGDFDFNWIGLINKASNTVAMIVHAPVQKKIKTASGQQGNVLTRSFMMEYNGASQITQITTPADTWQIDFTARLAGMDERIRKENIDTYGVASFYHDGFLVSQEDGGYSVKKGVGYVGGLRAELLLDKEIAAAELPVKVWVDVCWKGLLTSVWGVETKIAVAETLNDYSDNGQTHYVFAVAEIQADGAVVDLRGSPVKAGQEIIDDIAADLKKKQPLNDNLTALSGMEPVGDMVPFFEGGKGMALAALSEIGKDLLGTESIPALLEYLGLNKTAGTIPIGMPFFWANEKMPNELMPEWAGQVFLKWNGATFDPDIFPLLALTNPSCVLGDMRGDFIRVNDDGRGVDADRELMSHQDSAAPNITGAIPASAYSPHPNQTTGAIQSGTNNISNDADTYNATMRGGMNFDASRCWDGYRNDVTEVRPDNTSMNFLVRAA